MQVTVKLEGHLREFLPQLQEPKVIAFSEPLPVWAILKQAGVAPELPSSVICQGLRVDRDFCPADGDTLILLSPMAGG